MTILLPLVLSLSLQSQEIQISPSGKHENLIADPLFVSPVTGDFTLRPDSPALKLGFNSIDVSQVGPRPR